MIRYENLIDHSSNIPILGVGGGLALILLIIWEMAWKGIALWKAGRNHQLGWFIALFLLNTLGILPILYIYAFSPKRPKQ